MTAPRPLLLVVPVALTALLVSYACTFSDVSEAGRPCPCGDAGYACDLYRHPDGGLCVQMACDAGHTYCGGYACTDLASDPANCGGCGVVCTADPTAVGTTCNGDACSVQCPYQWALDDAGGCIYVPELSGDNAACNNECRPSFVCGESYQGGGDLAVAPLARCHCAAASDCGGADASCALAADLPPSQAPRYEDKGLCICGADTCKAGEVCGSAGCSCNGGAACDQQPSSSQSAIVCCADGCKDMGSTESCGACNLRCPPGFACTLNAKEVQEVGETKCTCTKPADCLASLGAIADCVDGRCVCGEERWSCLVQGQRCTTAGHGQAGCM